MWKGCASWIACLLVACAFAGCQCSPLSGEARDEHEGHEQHEEHDRPPPLCGNLRCGWGSPPEHQHASRRGTPYVHAFHAEPAFLGRDLLVHVEREGEEHGVEAEVEWALTRRLLAVVEVPYAWTPEDEGFGDVGMGLRALAGEWDRILLSAQVDVELPTAREGLGAGEVVVSPGLQAWADLGSWFTAQGSATLSLGTESETKELSWTGVLAKSFPLRPLVGSCHRPGAHGSGHREPSVLTLFLEGRGTYSIDGPERGDAFHELLLGLSIPVTEALGLRAGATVLWTKGEEEAEWGWIAGFVVHL